MLGALPVAAALRHPRLISLNVLSLRDQALLWERPAPNSAIQREIALATLWLSAIKGSLLFPATNVISNPAVTLVLSFPDEKYKHVSRVLKMHVQHYYSAMNTVQQWLNSVDESYKCSTGQTYDLRTQLKLCNLPFLFLCSLSSLVEHRASQQTCFHTSVCLHKLFQCCLFLSPLLLQQMCNIQITLKCTFVLI